MNLSVELTTVFKAGRKGIRETLVYSAINSENKKVGELWLEFDDSFVVYLSSFEIVEEYRRKGYGKEFLQQILNILFWMKIKAVWLLVDFANEPAQKLYRLCGFSFCGEITPGLNYKMEKKDGMPDF